MCFDAYRRRKPLQRGISQIQGVNGPDYRGFRKNAAKLKVNWSGNCASFASKINTEAEIEGKIAILTGVDTVKKALNCAIGQRIAKLGVLCPVGGKRTSLGFAEGRGVRSKK